MSTDTATIQVERLAPHIVCDDSAAAIEFYKQAFGAVEEMRLTGENGKIVHACISIGSYYVMLVDAFPEMPMQSPKKLGGSPVTLHLNVSDVDAFVDRAVKAGAKVVVPIFDAFWGDRYGVIEDPAGHSWSVATHVKDVPVDQLQDAMKQAMSGDNAHCQP